jgi:hypothetical protein
LLSVVTYLWAPDRGSRYTPYSADSVRLLQRMVERHLSAAHEFIVVTDVPEAFSRDFRIKAVPIDRTTHVPGTCYVRLHTFSPNAREQLGDRILRLDLDTVITGNLDPLVDRGEDLVLWRNPARWWMEKQGLRYAHRKEHPYGFWNGSMVLHCAGTMTRLWSEFDPQAPLAIDDDQYLSAMLGSDVPYWDQDDGVYRLENGHPRWRGSGVTDALPENARVVFFPGGKKPWLPEVISSAPWISQYRESNGDHQLHRQ